MADNIQTNWNNIQIVVMGTPNEPMVDREWMCYFHWIQSRDKHTKQKIKPKMYEQHKTLCYEYKNAILLKK